jgi:hypothetical protein
VSTILIEPVRRPRAAHDVLKRIGRATMDDSGLERARFLSSRLELFVWLRDGMTWAFELHTAIGTSDEWSLLWTIADGASLHRLTVAGSSRVMVPLRDEPQPIRELHAQFAECSRLLDEPIRRIVLIQLSRAARKTLQ